MRPGWSAGIGLTLNGEKIGPPWSLRHLDDVMDWFDELSEEDLEKLQRILENRHYDLPG